MNIRSFVLWSFFSVFPVALLSSPLHERVADLLSVQYQHDALAEEIAHSFSNSEKKQLVDTLLTTALHRRVVMPQGNGLWWFALPFAIIIDFIEGLSHSNNRNFHSRLFRAVSRLLDSANQAKEFSASIDTLNDLNTFEVQSKVLATGLTVGAVVGLYGAAYTQSSLGAVIFFIASAFGGGVLVSALNTGSAQLGEVASDVFAHTSAIVGSLQKRSLLDSELTAAWQELNASYSIAQNTVEKLRALSSWSKAVQARRANN